MKKLLISVVVPCYNEEKVLPLFYREITKVAEKMKKEAEFRFLFVNDGSRDKTREELEKLGKKDARVFYVSFSRNFGKEAAILAGLDHAKGDIVILMDADLQDPPEKIPEMVKAITEEGYDSVGIRRVTRKGEPMIRSFFAREFYKIINKISKVEMVDGARDYRAMSREFVEAVISMREYNRYFKGLSSFVGFRTKWLEYENAERVAGETKWSFWGLCGYAFEGIVAFSTMPLVVAVVLGVVLCLIAFIALIVIIIQTAIFGNAVEGWPSLACMILFLGGANLLAVGILGEYFAKAYLEVKGRPVYIVDQKRSKLG